MSDKNNLFLEQALIEEYKALKAEQNVRISMRDHLLYANLGIVGTVCYFAFSEHGSVHALLVIPWACFILGWTYLCNDEKVSDIREYVRTDLTKIVTAFQPPKNDHSIFEWEKFHRKGDHRMRYKITQLAVDITTFVLSGFAALCAYFLSIKDWQWWNYAATIFSLAIMVVLALEFVTHFIGDTKSIRYRPQVEPPSES